MRILFLNDEIDPTRGGGCEAHIATLWRGLEERGHEIRIASRNWRELIDWPDVVHVHNMVTTNYECLFDCIATRRPTLLSLHDYWPFCPSRMAVYQHRNCLAAGCRYQCGGLRPDWLDAVSRVHTVTFCQRAQQIFAQHGICTMLIPHGINKHFWHLRPNEPATNGLTRVAICTAWGTSSDWKGPDLAARIEALLTNGATFHWLFGGANREQVRDLYWRANVVLVPSRYEETFCLVAAEAQACGRPVVAFHVGGLRGLASCTVAEGNVAAAASALLGWRDLPLVEIRDYRAMAIDYEHTYERIRSSKH